jgi:hypothetical protein
MALAALLIASLLVAYPANPEPIAMLQSGDIQLDDDFGSSVAVSGNTAIVSAPSHGQGAAYIFESTAAGWRQTAELSSPFRTAGFAYSAPLYGGQSVAIAGNIAMVVGSDGRGHGLVYVFSQLGGIWRLHGALALVSPVYTFLSVAMTSTVAVVGDRYANAAYVFQREGMFGWFQTATLRTSDTGSVGFGSSVGITDAPTPLAQFGGAIVVGAPGLQGGTGGAYVFEMTIGGGWTQGMRLLPANPPITNASYGRHVAIVGETVGLVSDCSARPPTPLCPALVYVRTPRGWVLHASLSAADWLQPSGIALAQTPRGVVALIPEYFWDDQFGGLAGGITEFTLSGQTSSATATLSCGGMQDTNAFIGGVALDWSTAVVADVQFNNGSTGSACVFKA